MPARLCWKQIFKILNKIFKNDYDFSDYARAANIYWPGNKIGHGREDIENFGINLKELLVR